MPSSETLCQMRLLLLEGALLSRPGPVVLQHAIVAAAGVLDASSLSTLVQMVSAGIGVTLIPEMAVAVETRSASVSVDRFEDPQPSRTIGMIWRRPVLWPTAPANLRSGLPLGRRLARAARRGIVVAQSPHLIAPPPARRQLPDRLGSA